MNRQNFTYHININQTNTLIAQSILQGCLLEVSAFPKPGLVTPISSGSHNDMNYSSFMLGSASLAPCFLLSASYGMDDNNNCLNLLKSLRTIGITFEKELLHATNGINTQRGILFLGSIFCAAVGKLTQTNSFSNSDNNLKPVMTITNIGATIAQITKGICESELINITDDSRKTAGEIIYKKYGITGIRGEVESGILSIQNTAYPALCNALTEGLNLNDAIIHTLIHLMSVCDDSTIIWRSDHKTLLDLKFLAKQVVNYGGMLSPKGKNHFTTLTSYCAKKNLSPGGSADLLSVTIATYILLKNNLKLN